MGGAKNISFFTGLLFFVITFGAAFSLRAQTTNISTNSSQAAAASQAAGTTNVLLYYFALNVTAGTPSFTSINAFTTSGTYIAADLSNIKLWVSNFEFFGGASLVTIATLTTGLGPGTHTLSFSNPLPGTGQKYFWITCDLVSNAICSDNITCNLITSGMYTITGSKVFGTNVAGGTQTIAGGGCQTMPIELLNFSATPSSEGVKLNWSTATETFNDYFTVERSVDGVQYKECTRVKGAGNSLVEKNYSVQDHALSNDIVYYRLKQTDYNGAFTYFPAISVKRQLINGQTFGVYPNPSAGRFFVESVVPPGAKVKLLVTDAYGKLVLDEVKESEVQEIDLTEVESGIYFIKLVNETDGTIQVSRVLKH